MSVKVKFGPLIQFKYTKALIFFDSHSINHSIVSMIDLYR